MENSSSMFETTGTASGQRVFIMTNVPDTANTVDWTDICHTKGEFFAVRYGPVVFNSKGSAKATLPYQVERYVRDARGFLHFFNRGRFKTFEAALKRAKELANRAKINDVA